jgi:hypothetical protein
MNRDSCYCNQPAVWIVLVRLMIPWDWMKDLMSDNTSVGD